MCRHPEARPPHEGPFRILTVCTGNICRSPQAEQLLRARLPQAVPGAGESMLEVTSAGTIALDGNPMERDAAAEAIRLGIADTESHRARRLRTAQIEHADLVVALATEHRGAVVRAVPSAPRRTFTLIEFTRLVEMLADDRASGRVVPPGTDGAVAFLRRVVEAAADARGLLPLAATREIDVDDPYGRSARAYRRSADAVAEHVDRLGIALGALARR
ncbi:low molecular weight phosphatase family protein [Agrococcus sp. ProA11]|uniref:arsenate reductase/protein-tyrosine-phosphatase family protein n=1 Tax=Agrococcus chionoecetis TaxID=3153752 RepID=UPI00326077F3